MKRIISFVIWGNNELYNQGLIINIDEAKKYYPGWVCRVYCASDSFILNDLKNKDCEVVAFDPIIKDGVYSWNNIFHRLLPASDNDVEMSIFRDTDSRFSFREVGAVNEWIESNKALHVMHDDPTHYRYPICAGMWGIKCGWLPKIKEMRNLWCESKQMNDIYDKAIAVDETFLCDVIWPMFKYGNYLGHGIHEKYKIQPWGDNDRAFPLHEPMEYGRYIGQVIQLTVQRPKLPVFFHKKKIKNS